MSQFKVKPEQLDQCAEEIRRISHEMDVVRRSLDEFDVHSFLSGQAAVQLNSELKALSSHLENQKRMTGGLASALGKISLSYKTTENKLSEEPVFNIRDGNSPGEAGGTGADSPDSGESGKGKSPFPSNKSGPIKGSGTKTPDSGSDADAQDSESDSWAWQKAAIGAKGSVIGIKTGFEASGELIGTSSDESFTTGIKHKDNKLDSVSLIEAEKSGEFHVAKGKVKGSVGVFSNETEGYVGQVEAKGSVGATLIKDGKITPQVSLKGEISGDVAKAKNKTSIGSDNTNVNASAEGSVLSGSIKGDVGIGKINYKDKDGNEKQAYGASAEVKAEGYLAQGKVKGGFTIFGIKVNAGVSGKAGGAGVSAGDRKSVV